jgi:hypothetical protein
MGDGSRRQGTEDTGHRTGEFGIKNGATGMSDIEHVAIGIAWVDGNAARVAGASTGQCE